MAELAETEEVARRIRLLRGSRVILDVDLAAIYGVPTRVLNQAVKRNLRRFPSDFVFRLTAYELEDIRSQFATSSNRSQIVTGSQKHRDPRFLPYAFTEHGAIMAANILNSRRAVQMSVFVVRAFVRLREMIASHKDLAKRLDELEKKYDRQFKIVFDAIRQLMTPPMVPHRRIGFRREGPKRRPAALHSRRRRMLKPRCFAEPVLSVAEAFRMTEGLPRRRIPNREILRWTQDDQGGARRSVRVRRKEYRSSLHYT